MPDPHPGPHPVQTLRLPATLESLEELRALALSAGREAGLGAEALGRVELALEEAVVNISRHAYDPPGSGEVAFSAQALPAGGLRLILADRGKPFDPVRVSEEKPELEAGLEANLGADLEHRLPGGMGLFLIRSLAQTGYRREGNENVLTLDFAP